MIPDPTAADPTVAILTITLIIVAALLICGGGIFSILAYSGHLADQEPETTTNPNCPLPAALHPPPAAPDLSDPQRDMINLIEAAIIIATRDRCRELNLTYPQLAEHMGITHTDYIALISGAETFTLETLADILIATDSTITITIHDPE